MQEERPEALSLPRLRSRGAGSSKLSYLPPEKQCIKSIEPNKPTWAGKIPPHDESKFAVKYSLPTPLPTLQVFPIVFFTTHERVQDARFQTAGATNHDANVTQNPTKFTRRLVLDL